MGTTFRLDRREPARSARRRDASVACTVATYVVAGVSYAIAGILLAGYLDVPSLMVGKTYLLPTVAAVVLGGTSLLGGVGSVAASAVGAVFLVQLEQETLGMGRSGLGTRDRRSGDYRHRNGAAARAVERGVRANEAQSEPLRDRSCLGLTGGRRSLGWIGAGRTTRDKFSSSGNRSN